MVPTALVVSMNMITTTTILFSSTSLALFKGFTYGKAVSGSGAVW